MKFNAPFTIHYSLFTKRGFTLIEVLVALAIVSVVIAALYSTFFLSRKAVDAVDDSLVRMQECRAVVDMMKREIESALYDPAKTSEGKTYTLFKLDDRDFYGKQASQLAFTTFSPLLPGVSKITYTVEENDGKLNLKKNIASAYAKAAVTKDTELIEDIESFTVEAKYNDKWVKTWDGATSDSIPEIRISIKIFTKNQTGSESDHSPSDSFTVSDIAKPRYGKTS